MIKLNVTGWDSTQQNWASKTATALGRFREDLFYRIAVLTAELRSLEELEAIELDCQQTSHRSHRENCS